MQIKLGTFGSIIRSLFNEKIVDQPDYLLPGKKTILVIDDNIPQHDQSSGSKRLFELLLLFKKLDLSVIFLPFDGKLREPYYTQLINANIKVLPFDSKKKHGQKEFRSLLPFLNYAWISRPELNRLFQPIFKKKSNCKIIFDTVDLHYIRLQRQAELNAQRKNKALKIKDLEISLAKQADVTVTVTETEKKTLENENVRSVFVIPNIHYKHTHEIDLPFSDREGILFIGGYLHEPNVDAVLWLNNEIMPIVRKELGDIPLYLLGSNPPPPVLELKTDHTFVPGYIADVSEHFLKSRIFVAPLRYGAGMKGKIGQSLEYNLPIVSTHIGIEGMDLTDNYNVLQADDANAFALKIIQLYRDEKLWNKLRAHAANSLTKYSPEYVLKDLERLFTSIES